MNHDFGQALVAWQEKNDDALPGTVDNQRIDVELRLDGDGKLVECISHVPVGKDDRLFKPAPMQSGRTAGIIPHIGFDLPGYVLGERFKNGKVEKTPEHHDEFVEAHRKLKDDGNREPGLHDRIGALLEFLGNDAEKRKALDWLENRFPKKWGDKQITFTFEDALDEGMLCENPALLFAVSRVFLDKGDECVCGITGRRDRISAASDIPDARQGGESFRYVFRNSVANNTDVPFGVAPVVGNETQWRIIRAVDLLGRRKNGHSFKGGDGLWHYFFSTDPRISEAVPEYVAAFGAKPSSVEKEEDDGEDERVARALRFLSSAPWKGAKMHSAEDAVVHWAAFAMPKGNESNLNLRSFRTMRLGDVETRMRAHFRAASAIEFDSGGKRRKVFLNVKRMMDFATGGDGKSKLDSASCVAAIMDGKYPRRLVREAAASLEGVAPRSGAVATAILAAYLENQLGVNPMDKEKLVDTDEMRRMGTPWLLGLFWSLCDRIEYETNDRSLPQKYTYGRFCKRPLAVFSELHENFVDNRLTKLKRERPGRAVNFGKMVETVMSVLDAGGIPEKRYSLGGGENALMAQGRWAGREWIAAMPEKYKKEKEEQNPVA